MTEEVVSVNRSAKHFYHIDDSLEVGLILTGAEVKSLRARHVSLNQAHAVAKKQGLFLINCHIAPYAQSIAPHQPRRPRQLLLHKRQMLKMALAVKKDGVTLIPLRLYFNEKGKAKLELGVARGKKKKDRRRDLKEREWKREREQRLKRA